MKLNKYTCYKGRHDFQLWGRVLEMPCIRRKFKRATWTVRFDDTCAYTLPGADQRDWNKGGGISFDLFTNHTDSAMWAWRWNPERGMVQLAAYAHIDGKRVIAKTDSGPDESDKEVMMEVGAGETLTVMIEKSGKQYHCKFESYRYGMHTWIDFSHEKKAIRTIGSWFGGNQKAPSRINIFVNRKIE